MPHCGLGFLSCLDVSRTLIIDFDNTGIVTAPSECANNPPSVLHPIGAMICYFPGSCGLFYK